MNIKTNKTNSSKRFFIAVAEEERKVKIMEEDIMVKQKVCEEDLEKAEPALTAAMAALNTLNKVNYLFLQFHILGNVTNTLIVLLLI